MRIQIQLFCLCILLTETIPATNLEAQQYSTAQQSTDRKSSDCAKVQLSARFDFDNTEQRTTYWNTRSQCMAKSEWAPPAALLVKDETVLEKTYPTIRDFYISRTYSKQDVARIMTLAWIGYRRENPSKLLSTSSFIQLSTSFGQLTVTSSPDGASITVDTNLWDGSTNRTDWTESGDRTVKLMKEKCQPEEGKVTVVAGGHATFHRNLTCH
jgi:hypothetical protein